jgi:hypothetical protein
MIEFDGENFGIAKKFRFKREWQFGIKILCSLVVFCLVIVTIGINSYALNTGFTYDEISESRKENSINTKKFSLVSEAPSGRSIVAFDVNEKGMIALGHDLPNLKKGYPYTILMETSNMGTVLKLMVRFMSNGMAIILTSI